MSRDLRNKVENSLREINFRGSSLKELKVIDGINIEEDSSITIILNIEHIKSSIVECKKEIERMLPSFFKKVSFIETNKRAVEREGKKKFKNIKKVILISSGKGGVGKTTITYYTARALADLGFKVGVLDADIYGPSIPVIASIDKEPKTKDGFFVPIEKDGVKYNSVGFLIPANKSLVWRGPMITKAVHKLFNSTAWGELEYLLVDMPPGTGDIHLTICQTYHVDQILMVTTPSKLSEADVSRAEDMYNKLGLKNQIKLCNMAFLEQNNQRIYPFGSSLDKHQLELAVDKESQRRLKMQIQNLVVNRL